MSKTPPKKAKPSAARRVAANAPSQADFDAVLGLIEAARTKAYAAVNTTLIELYWSIGQYISRKAAEDGWGKGTVDALAQTIRRRYPTLSGYSSRNLWRMSQFFETYRNQPKLSPLVTELSWSHNLAIMSRSKRDEEREFYLRLAGRQRWSFRELQRQAFRSLVREKPSYRLQNCQHRWQNYTPRPRLSSRTPILWSFSTSPGPIPKAISSRG